MCREELTYILVKFYGEHLRFCFFRVTGKCTANGGFDVLGTIIESFTRYLRLGPSHVDTEVPTSSLCFSPRHVDDDSCSYRDV